MFVRIYTMVSWNFLLPILKIIFIVEKSSIFRGKKIGDKLSRVNTEATLSLT